VAHIVGNNALTAGACAEVPQEWEPKGLNVDHFLKQVARELSRNEITQDAASLQMSATVAKPDWIIVPEQLHWLTHPVLPAAHPWAVELSTFPATADSRHSRAATFYVRDDQVCAVSTGAIEVPTEKPHFCALILD
jgi:hypothetical protein